MDTRSAPNPAALKGILGLSGLVALTALVTLAGCLIASATPWFLLGFEVVVLFAAVFGVMVGLGRVREALPLAALCVAGAVLAGSFLGYLGAGKALVGVAHGPIPLMWWMAFRAVASLLIACCGGLIMLLRRADVALPRLAKGLACGAGFLVLGGGLWAMRGKIAAWNLPDAVMAMGGLAILAVLLGLLAASVHLCVRAFEACALPEPELDRLKA